MAEEVNGPAGDPWPLVVRVTGGRVNHLARWRMTRTGRATLWLDLACGGSCLADALDNGLREAVCSRCMARAEQDRNPGERRAAAAKRRARRVADHGQHPLPFPI
ncbi:hypothetical protein [Kitasatospora terrestris]|uniref:Uncharacterized protein n=1 Tax=Kitasatospora terrestris TaxID=258051 RepID=A0ABP9EU24_9ACTN